MLHFYLCRLEGTIPTEISVFPRLSHLELGGNYLNGSIPSEIANLGVLTYIACGLNSIDGTIPVGIGLMTNLEFIGFSYNNIQGSVPSSFTNLIKMEFFSIRYNQLSAAQETLDAIASFPRLVAFLVNTNNFAGNFENALFASSLKLLRLSDNYFSGDMLLSKVCTLSQLDELSIYNNLFSGSVPSCIGNLSKLVILDLGYNYLRGTIPSSMKQLVSLERIELQTNLFTGNIADVFLTHTLLSTVVFSDNRFTGNLPTLNTSALIVLVATKNCFSGTLSTSLCSLSSLRTLALSGLASSSHCRSSNWLGFTRSIGGDIPFCLFNMPSLEQLYVSGNGIQSKLSELPVTSNLENISLSYNRLSGSIPLSIQQKHDIFMLDLSFNRLLGTIEGMTNYSFNSNVSIRTNTVLVEANQLSG